MPVRKRLINLQFCRNYMFQNHIEIIFLSFPRVISVLGLFCYRYHICYFFSSSIIQGMTRVYRSQKSQVERGRGKPQNSDDAQTMTYNRIITVVSHALKADTKMYSGSQKVHAELSLPCLRIFLVIFFVSFSAVTVI